MPKGKGKLKKTAGGGEEEEEYVGEEELEKVEEPTVGAAKASEGSGGAASPAAGAGPAAAAPRVLTAERRAQMQEASDALVAWARSQGRISEGMFGGERRPYVKGDAVLDFLAQYKKEGLESLADAGAASRFFSQMLGVREPSGRPVFFYRVSFEMETVQGAGGEPIRRKKRTSYPNGPVVLKNYETPAEAHLLEAEGRYLVMVQESKFWQNLPAVLIVLGIILFNTIRMWPYWVRVPLWYVLVTLSILLLGIIALQWVVYLAVLPFGYELVIFPRLWDETATIWNTFDPSPRFAALPAASWYYRLAAIALIVLVALWLYSQPTSYDEFVSSQKTFVDDLYSGKFISDISANQRTDAPGAARGAKRIPTLEELQAMQAEEAEAHAAAAREQAADAAIEADIERQAHEPGDDAFDEDALDAAVARAVREAQEQDDL
jgi:hypothetical protein